MCDRMTHRGPDGRGVWEGGRVALGHLRLSIIDLSGGAQPLAGCTPDVQVTFNGEIFNYLSVKAELEAKGHVFKTKSDTEVLAHGWEEWGERLPEKLRGMFAFAIWDAKRQVLFLSRDRLGKKPLYYARVGRDLVFASEVKALFASPGVKRELDRSQLPSFLALRYVPGPATLFKGIQRLQPGHSLRFQNGEVTVWPYWDLPLSQPTLKLEESEAQERFLHLFEEAVRIRLMADVPVGVFLSGGLDSTAVTWAMRQNVTGPLKSFSAGYMGDPNSELTYARLAAKALKTEHHEVLLTPEGFRDFMPRLAWHLDEPIADAACIPLYYLSERARQEGVVVVLSGEGADELLAGYPIYAKQLVMEQIHRRVPFASQAAQGLSRFVTDAKLRKYLQWVGRPFESRYLGISRAFSDEALLEEMIRGLPGPSAADRLQPLHERTQGLSALSRMLYSDVKSWLPDDLLIKADKMSMAASIELRTPFLDHELMELCWSLPDQFKLKGWVGKYLLRQGMATQLPQEILTRPKRGFPVPTGSWLRNQLHGQLREELLASDSACRSLFPASTVERLLDQHRAGQDRTEEVFALWCLENWSQCYLGHEAPAQGSSRAASSDVFDATSTRTVVPGTAPGTQPSWKDSTPAGIPAKGMRPEDTVH